LTQTSGQVRTDPGIQARQKKQRRREGNSAIKPRKKQNWGEKEERFGKEQRSVRDKKKKKHEEVER